MLTIQRKKDAWGKYISIDYGNISIVIAWRLSSYSVSITGKANRFHPNGFFASKWGKHHKSIKDAFKIALELACDYRNS